MANNNQIYKMSNAGGFKSLTRYYDMLAGNTVWNPWEPQGAYDALATVTVPSGGAASVTFAGIPTDYKHLQVRLLSRISTTDVNVAIKLNSDAGSNYMGHFLYGTGSAAAAGALATSTTPPFITRSANSSNSSSIFGGGVIDILDYQNTNKYKTMRALSGYDGNGSGEIFFNSALWMSTNAVTQIDLSPTGGSFVQYSSFALYGIK